MMARQALGLAIRPPEKFGSKFFGQRRTNGSNMHL